jgi:uncharacterized protein (DUF3084 family)
MSEAIEPEVVEVVEKAPAYMVIETVDQANQVAAYLKQIRAVRTKIEEWFAPMRDSAHKAWKAIVARQNELDKRPSEIEAVCKRMLAAWQDAEAQRIEAEQKRLDDEARKAAVAAALAEGDTQQAKAIQKGTVAVVSSQVVAPAAKVAGVTARQLWQAEVTDLKALVKAVASGKASATYLLPNMTALNAVARATNGNVTIAGVTIRQVTSIAARK